MKRRPEALADLNEQAAYLGRKSGRFELELAFLEAAEATFEWLSEMPGAGSPKRASTRLFPNLRVWPVKGFEDVLILYVEVEGGIEVLRVLHARRNWLAYSRMSRRGAEYQPSRETEYGKHRRRDRRQRPTIRAS